MRLISQRSGVLTKTSSLADAMCDLFWRLTKQYSYWQVCSLQACSSLSGIRFVTRGEDNNELRLQADYARKLRAKH